MANSILVQTIVDGPRNTIIKVTGIIDTADVTVPITIADPALLIGVDNTGGLKAAKLKIGRIVHTVEDALEVRLFWDATTPVLVEVLTGRAHLEYAKNFGGLINNAGAGVNGKITLTTQGWSASATLSFTIVIELIKQLT
jgi:hypothetical protein